jgi:hypothetical protein
VRNRAGHPQSLPHHGTKIDAKRQPGSARVTWPTYRQEVTDEGEERQRLIVEGHTFKTISAAKLFMRTGKGL